MVTQLFGGGTRHNGQPIAFLGKGNTLGGFLQLEFCTKIRSSGSFSNVHRRPTCDHEPLFSRFQPRKASDQRTKVKCRTS